MNPEAIRQLAKELKAEIYTKIESETVKKLHVHEKFAVRKVEIENLKKTDNFKEELAKALKEDQLYQDCNILNMDNTSALMRYYKEDEELYDKMFETYNGKERFLTIVRNYRAEEKRKLDEWKEQEAERFLDSVNIDEKIFECDDDILSEIISNIEQFLINKKLEIKEKTYRYSNYYYPFVRSTEITSENYDDFINDFCLLDEETLLQMAGYDYAFLSSVICERVLENNPDLKEIAEDCDFYEHFADEFGDAGYIIWNSIQSYFSEDKLLGLLSQNRYLKDDIAFVQQIKAGVLEKIPDKLPNLFPIARNRKRKFIIHLGPTNSGKTYDAVESLKRARKGLYLAPLRLLAFEQYQKLNEEGYPCSLYTGEEHKIINGAKLQSSTVEIADVVEHYDVVVIDEAQMVADKDRGWAWTKAILGINADEIHICAAPYAKDIIIHTIEECGDDFEVVNHYRQTPLLMDEDKFKLRADKIQKGDALIVFSRRAVHAIARELQDMNMRCSVIYGNLPYDVRQEEARRFRDGETDIVVATDAIGMGMNLPIRRVVFLETAKYDGYETRQLKTEEVTQIAGRAGRRGIYEEGYWTVLGDKPSMNRIMNRKVPQIKEARIGFPETLITINAKISAIIKRWNEVELPEGYVHASLEHESALCPILEQLTDNKTLIYSFITIPFDEKNLELMTLWERAFSLVQKKEKLTIHKLMTPSFSEKISLEEAEALYKRYDLTYSLLEIFSKDENEINKILKLKHDLSMAIAELLKKAKLPHRTCKYCGKKLSWNYPFGMCSHCHDVRFPKYNRWNDYDDYNDEDFWF